MKLTLLGLLLVVIRVSTVVRNPNTKIFLKVFKIKKNPVGVPTLSVRMVEGSSLNFFVDLAAFKPCSIRFDGCHLWVTLGVRHKGSTYVRARFLQHLLVLWIFRCQRPYHTQFVFFEVGVFMDPFSKFTRHFFKQRLVDQL